MFQFLRRCVILLVCSLVLSCSVVSAQAAAVIPGAQRVIAPFQPLLAGLQSQRVPIVLPTELLSVYPYLRSVEPTGYEISLDHTADCHGLGYCSDGLLSGKAINQTMPSIGAQYAFETKPGFQPEARSPEQMADVNLARRIKGYFVPYVCGATCDTSKVVWEQGGYRYSVGIRNGSKAAVVTLANSAIENEICSNSSDCR